MRPPGCKNLIDALELSRRQTMGRMATGGFPPVEIKEERFPTAGLAQIGRYVAMLLQSRGELFTLAITAREFEFPVTLYRCTSEQTVAIVLVSKDAHREQAIRCFFEQHAIELLLDHAPSDLGAADAARGLVYPLAADTARAITLTTELLRIVYGLSDEAGLDFRYYEMEPAAS